MRKKGIESRAGREGGALRSGRQKILAKCAVLGSRTKLDGPLHSRVRIVMVIQHANRTEARFDGIQQRISSADDGQPRGDAVEQGARGGQVVVATGEEETRVVHRAEQLPVLFTRERRTCRSRAEVLQERRYSFSRIRMGPADAMKFDLAGHAQVETPRAFRKDEQSLLGRCQAEQAKACGSAARDVFGDRPYIRRQRMGNDQRGSRDGGAMRCNRARIASSSTMKRN